MCSTKDKEYQRCAEELKAKSRMITAMANYVALYVESDGCTVEQQWKKVLSLFNDEDIQMYYHQREKKRKELERRFGRRSISDA